MSDYMTEKYGVMIPVVEGWSRIMFSDPVGIDPLDHEAMRNERTRIKIECYGAVLQDLEDMPLSNDNQFEIKDGEIEKAAGVLCQLFIGKMHRLGYIDDGCTDESLCLFANSDLEIAAGQVIKFVHEIGIPYRWQGKVDRMSLLVALKVIAGDDKILEKIKSGEAELVDVGEPGESCDCSSCQCKRWMAEKYPDIYKRMKTVRVGGQTAMALAPASPSEAEEFKRMLKQFADETGITTYDS